MFFPLLTHQLVQIHSVRMRLLARNRMEFFVDGGHILKFGPYCRLKTKAISDQWWQYSQCQSKQISY